MLKNRNLMIIALIAVVNALGYGIIIPILYSYSMRFGLTDFQNGLLFALFSLCQFFSTPIIGRLSDRFGRKPLLITSIAGTALSFVMLAFAPNAIFLFLGRALDGITAGNIPVASAVITDTTEPKDRAKGFGIIGASFGFGFIFGPAISAFTVGISPALPFLIAAAISLLAVIITWIFLPETNKNIGQVSKTKLFDFSKLWHALTNRTVGLTLIMTLFYFMAFSMFIFGFQSSTVKVLNMSPNQISLLFTLFGALGLISQLVLLQQALKFLKIKKTLLYSLAWVAAIFIVMFLAKSILVFVIASIALGLVNSFVQPITQTILSEEVDDSEQGEMQGINASYMSIGQIIGPIIAGGLASISIMLPFLGASVLMIACLFIALKIFKSLSGNVKIV
ncbi:MAG: MFS transporter [Candidatus Levybacteria bacterium]|nr:MFS transporter [Candidatus Levybacteria bacterium]